MKEKDDILKKALEAIKQEQIHAGPSKDLADSTLKKLNQVSSQLPQEHFDKQVMLSKRFMIINNLVRIAATIILSISIGYAAGRLSTPKQPDIQQIRSELEPAIREQLLQDVTQYVQLGITSGYMQVKEELIEQSRLDLNQAALEILNTSGAMTNKLLEELINSIEDAQVQDRQWVVAAIQKIEQNRLEDKNQLGNAFVNFASRTDENMAVIAKFLSNTNPNDLVPKEIENQNN
jgi:hypothetical protein